MVPCAVIRKEISKTELKAALTHFTGFSSLTFCRLKLILNTEQLNIFPCFQTLTWEFIFVIIVILSFICKCLPEVHKL